MAGQDVAAVVALHPGQPVGRGSPPIITNRAAAGTSSIVPVSRWRRTRPSSRWLAEPADHLGAQPHGHVRGLLDLLDQVVGHALGQVGARGPAGSPRRRTWPGGARPGRPSCRPRPRTRPGPPWPWPRPRPPRRTPRPRPAPPARARPGAARRRPEATTTAPAATWPPSDSRTRRRSPSGRSPVALLGQDTGWPRTARPAPAPGWPGRRRRSRAGSPGSCGSWPSWCRPGRRPPAAPPPGCRRPSEAA